MGVMRTIVVGAGAIGGVLGGQLARSGVEVILISTNERHVAAINRRGLIVNGIHGTFTVPVRAVSRPDEVEFQEGDFVILTTKCFACSPAVAAVRQATDLELPVFCAQ